MSAFEALGIPLAAAGFVTVIALAVLCMRVEFLVQDHRAPRNTPSLISWKAWFFPFGAFDVVYGAGYERLGDRAVTCCLWTVRIGLPLFFALFVVRMLAT